MPALPGESPLEILPPDGTAEGFAPSDLLAIAPSAPDDLERSERQARLERALRELPDHQRVPLVLFHFEELSYQDIAHTLGVSLGKVKTDIHRGREALRLRLGTE